jgi:hypothetical protein
MGVRLSLGKELIVRFWRRTGIGILSEVRPPLSDPIELTGSRKASGEFNLLKDQENRWLGHPNDH